MENYMLKELRDLCKGLLFTAQSITMDMGTAAASEIRDQYVTDISTAGERAIAQEISARLKGDAFPCVFRDEDLGIETLAKNPCYCVDLDDYDGTNNQKRGQGVLPYCTVVAISDSPEPKFKDVVVAGVLEHLSGTVWIATRGHGGIVAKHHDYHSRPVRSLETSGQTQLGRAPINSVIAIEGYNTGDRVAMFKKIYGEGWPKDFCTSALHLAGVSSGMFDGWLNPDHKPHELGAGYLLVKEAGGYIRMFTKENGVYKSQPMDDVPIDWKRKYPVVAAATEQLGETLVSKIE